MFKHLKERLFHKHKLGLEPLFKDGTEFNIGALWGLVGEYVPKKQSSGINPLSVKVQLYNTCSFNSWTTAKEIDEGCELDPRFVVIMAKKYGLLSGDGWANQKAAEIIGQKFGVCERGILPDYGNTNLSWEDYSNYNLITADVLNNAAKHKTQSYWFVGNHNEALKAIDEGHPVRFGVGWRTSMNMSGGFSVPWLLNFLIGYLVGGHDIFAFDWDLNYQGKRVFICQNSYGKTYGNNGKMYITFEDFDKQVATYSATANLDIAKNVAQWILDKNGKCVKELNSLKVYFIENGKKRLFPDELTFWSFGFSLKDIIIDDENMLPQIPEGDGFLFAQGKDAERLKEIIRGMDSGRVKELSTEYFPEFIN